jgi:hypothetical protein
MSLVGPSPPVLPAINPSFFFTVDRCERVAGELRSKPTPPQRFGLVQDFAMASA